MRALTDSLRGFLQDADTGMQRPRNNGDSSLDAKLLDQLSRMKDKNRKAQKRYREKQKVSGYITWHSSLCHRRQN